MKTRQLGLIGPKVSAMGWDCMGMSDFYSAYDNGESIATIHHALDCGLSFSDTAHMYGPFTNELLLNKVLQAQREEVFIATKFGIMRGAKILRYPELMGARSMCSAH
jgi:aryl-alcohol dehydrogenase-like predicted oxidoreductase